MLPSQHLKFPHHKEFPLQKLKEWLSNILDQIYCKDTLKCIKTITNVVTLNRPSIKSILCNTRHISRHLYTKPECIQHQDCITGKHYCQQLKNIPELQKIGKVNANTIPYPSHNSMLKNITNTLAQTLKCHLILRHANFKNKPKQTKISKENINKHIPIITNDSIKLISEIRLQKLWEQYTALTVESDFPSFTNTIIKTASNIKLQNTQKWSIAPMLGDFLWKDLGCSIERNVSIFNFNTKINLFQPSPYIKEKTDPPWTLKAFTNTSHNPTEIKHYLTLALYATHINNTTTFMFIPEPTDADMEYYTLLRHHYVGFLANWPEKTFYLQSHTDNKLYSDHKINLVCIAQKSASLNLKQKNTLNNISLQIFKTIPTYTITKPNTKLNTEARQTLSEMISGKINKYLTQQMQTNPEKLPTRTNTKKINSITLKFILQQFPIKQIISDKLLKNIEEACKDYHPCKDKEVITDNDIDEAKKFLRKTLVISQTDKNKGCLVAECPLGYYLRVPITKD